MWGAVIVILALAVLWPGGRTVCIRARRNSLDSWGAFVMTVFTLLVVLMLVCIILANFGNPAPVMR